MKKTALYVLAVMAIAGSAYASNPHPQKPGEWQTTTQMEVPGMPFKMPPVSFSVCITEEDLKDPEKSVPKDPKSDCKIGDYKIDGNTVSWSIDCPKQKTTGEGEITFTETSYTGVMKMKVQDQEMTAKYSGKWKGECTKK